MNDVHEGRAHYELVYAIRAAPLCVCVYIYVCIYIYIHRCVCVCIYM